MKTLNFILLFFLSINCFANDIDKIQTNEDVYKFLVKKVDRKFKNNSPLVDNPKLNDTAKYGRNKFFKIDIDNNGLTDLIIYSYRKLFVVLDNGKSNYTVRYLDNGTFSLNNATLISIDTTLIPRKIIIQQREKPESQIDTLIFKFNNFIEYNSNPTKDFSFEKITIKTNQCFGTCPIFEMTINKDRTATYKAIMYNDETGEFKSIIPISQFDELIELLNYLQLDKFQNNYEVNWTDDQTVSTEISYNGKSKTISDYGEIGTFGLSRLYSKLFSWRKVIQWTE